MHIVSVRRINFFIYLIIHYIVSFSAICNDVRNQYQQDYAVWITLLASKRIARINKSKAKRDFDRAVSELDESRRNQAEAEADWDAKIAGIAALPTLGAPSELEAKFEPAGKSSTLGGHDGHPVGPFPIRPDKINVLWGKSEIKDILNTWIDIAKEELTRTIFLAKDVKRRIVEVDIKQNAFNAAQQNLNSTEAILAKAEKAVNELKMILNTLESQMKILCAGQTKLSDHEGIIIEIDPGVLPEDEDEVTDELEKAKSKERKGLNKIKIQDGEGPSLEWTDANGVVHVATSIGWYDFVDDDITIYNGGKRSATGTLKHEIGHHVYFHRLTKEGHEKWTAFWNLDNNKKTIRQGGKMPSEYAGKDSIEGFAECYEALRCNKTLDPTTKAKMEEVLRMLKP